MHSQFSFRNIKIIGALCIFAAISGCATTVAYKPEYITQEPIAAVSEQIPGKGLVYMDNLDATYTFKGTPHTFTGGGVTLVMPLGSMTQQIARLALQDFFSNGVDVADSLAHAVDYQAVIQPRVYNFTYGYNSLKNLGLAVTPDIDVTLGIKLLDARGVTVLEKSYSSGKVEAKTYFMSASPQEHINRTAHQQIYRLMRQAAVDIRDYLKTRSADPYSLLSR